LGARALHGRGLGGYRPPISLVWYRLGRSHACVLCVLLRVVVVVAEGVAVGAGAGAVAEGCATVHVCVFAYAYVSVNVYVYVYVYVYVCVWRAREGGMVSEWRGGGHMSVRFGGLVRGCRGRGG
jgi:hypothetical protein